MEAECVTLFSGFIRVKQALNYKVGAEYTLEQKQVVDAITAVGKISTIGNEVGKQQACAFSMGLNIEQALARHFLAFF